MEEAEAWVWDEKQGGWGWPHARSLPVVAVLVLVVVVLMEDGQGIHNGPGGAASSLKKHPTSCFVSPSLHAPNQRTASPTHHTDPRQRGQE